MFSYATRGFVLMLSLFLFNCADTTKYQGEYRGNWSLQSRTNAQGQETLAPEISGIMEWFPTSKNQAHLMVTISTNREAIQVFEGVYTLQDKAFTVKPHLLVGGMLGTAPDETYESAAEPLSGQIQSEDARVKLQHNNGTTFEYIGAELTITYKNGVVDRWKRLRDQKGALEN